MPEYTASQLLEQIRAIVREEVSASVTARNPAGEKVLSASKAAELMRERLVNLTHEEFWAILLDARLRVRKMVRIASGGLSQCSVLPREALRPAIVEECPAVMFMHNHPSGDPTPSADDLRLNRMLTDGGNILGIRVVDHLVLGADGWHSDIEGRGAW